MRETSSSKLPSGGMHSVLRLFGDFFQSRMVQVARKQAPITGALPGSGSRTIRILTAHRRRIRETGEAVFVYRRFSLFYKRNDGEKRLRHSWTIRQHGIHGDEERKLLEELKEFLSLRSVSLIPTSDSAGQHFQLMVGASQPHI